MKYTNEENAKYFKYLFELQKSGATNMFGAGAYLQRKFYLDVNGARDVLVCWMEHYDEIAKELNIEV